MLVQSLGLEDPVEEEMATHSSNLAGRIPWTEEPGRLQSIGLQRVGHPTPEARGSGREEPPCARGQGWRPGGATPRPRSSGCAGAGGPRGAILRCRSRRAVVRRYPSPKVRSSSCTFLEQP